MAKTSGDGKDGNASDVADTGNTMAASSVGESSAAHAGLSADDLFGMADADASAQSDTLLGSEQDEHVWDGSFPEDDPLDAFVKQTGTGTDYIHDFEVEADVVDLSAYNISYQDLQSVMQDVGWATQIELTGFSGQVDDRIYLKNVEPDQLNETNFSL